MSTLGALSSRFIIHSVNDHVFDYLMAFVVGTFLHIATTILFENSENHRFSWSKIWAILLGILLAVVIS
jgi:zinc transporter ZupT